jgi:hypothetical protein
MTHTNTHIANSQRHAGLDPASPVFRGVVVNDMGSLSNWYKSRILPNCRLLHVNLIIT